MGREGKKRRKKRREKRGIREESERKRGRGKIRRRVTIKGGGSV